MNALRRTFIRTLPIEYRHPYRFRNLHFVRAHFLEFHHSLQCLRWFQLCCRHDSTVDPHVRYVLHHGGERLASQPRPVHCRPRTQIGSVRGSVEELQVVVRMLGRSRRARRKV